MLKGLKKLIVIPRREIKEFLSTVTIQQLGLGMINIFEPVYLYTMGVSPIGIALFYLAVYVPYFFTIPFGGKIAKSFGFEHTLTISTFFNIAYYLALIAVPVAPFFLFVAPFLLMAQKTLWWPAYHANFARYSKQKQTGREIGLMQVIYNLTSAVGPLLGGLILAISNFSVLYAVVVGLLLVSVLPMFTTPEKFKPKDFSWRTQMRFIFRPEYRKRLIAGLGFGDELVHLVFWPLFIYLVFNNVLDLGLVVAISTAITILVALIAAHWSDSQHRKKVLWWSATFNALSWLGRPFAFTFGNILGIDAVARASKNALLIPIYCQVYDDAKKDHIMPHVVGFEQVLVLGKILALLLALALYPLFGFAALFVLGAVMSLFYFVFH